MTASWGICKSLDVQILVISALKYVYLIVSMLNMYLEKSVHPLSQSKVAHVPS